MKTIYSFLMGFSFFVVKLLIDNATADISGKPVWIGYIALPMLVSFLYWYSIENKRERTK